MIFVIYSYLLYIHKQSTFHFSFYLNCYNMMINFWNCKYNQIKLKTLSNYPFIAWTFLLTLHYIINNIITVVILIDHYIMVTNSSWKFVPSLHKFASSSAMDKRSSPTILTTSYEMTQWQFGTNKIKSILTLFHSPSH